MAPALREGGTVKRPRLEGLWRHPDFLRFWAGRTTSVFGTIIGRLAIAFTAILWLDATPLEIAVLGICDLAPGFLFGVVAGVWVDRLPRRAILIWSDIGRFVVLVTVPLAALGDALTIWQLFAVALIRNTLDALFETAYQAYLPTLVGPAHLLEGNSKLSATASAAEFTGFGAAGWLVQLLTAPGAVLVDAISFLASAFAIWRIRAPEAPVAGDGHEAGILRSAGEGIAVVAKDPILRALGASLLAFQLPMGIFGAIFVVFVTRELDLGPGLQGSIYAIGGVTSFLGAAVAARSGSWHLGRSMATASFMRSAGNLLPVLAAGPLPARVSLLAAGQCVTDPAWTFYEIHETSLRQAATAPGVLGRVTATFRAAEFGAGLIGMLAGGLLAEAVGLRTALVAAAVGGVAAAAVFAALPAARLRRLPTVVEA